MKLGDSSFRMVFWKNLLIVVTILLFATLTYRCVDPYSPRATQANYGYLVVEGLLCDSSGTTSVSLSHTSTLADSSENDLETGAMVTIEGDNGTSYNLTEVDFGLYTADKLMIDISRNFRVRIKTSAGKEYSSDFVPFRKTPVIDSVNYSIDDTNLHLLVNTHDQGNDTRYYLWRYDGTWSYHSAYKSTIKMVDGRIVQRDLLDDTYHCWRTVHSTQILVGSSARLADDIISNFELLAEPRSGEKLQDEYSILVKQYAITGEAYNYWQELKKNTENLGTLFGPQPSTVATNLHCLTNSAEPVLGYFSASSVQQVRKTILSSELPPIHHSTGYEACSADTLLLDQVPYFTGSEMLVNELFHGMPPVLIGYLMANEDCVDCTKHGGTTIKPAYWE